MRQAERISRMKSSALADHGRRLSGFASLGKPAAVRSYSLARELAAAGTDIPVSDALRLALKLGAAACGVDEAEFVRRAIVEKARAIDLISLSDARSLCGGGEEVSCQSHKLEVAGSNPSPATSFVPVFSSRPGEQRGGDCDAAASAPDFHLPAVLTAEGDLTDLPHMVRAAFPRFASGP